MKWLVFVLLIGFVSAVDVELSCPDEIFVDEEFECKVEVFDGEGVYDLKVEIDEERDSVLKTLNEGEWKSGYYYLKEFVEDEVKIRLKVLGIGRYDVVVKLRQGSEREEFNVGRIRVLKGEDVEPRIDADLDKGNVEVILLGGDVVVENEEWDYVSKDGQIVNLLPYGFCLFLILLVGIMMWSR